MPAIAIVDDRHDNRETIVRAVQTTLRSLGETDTWSVVSGEPPSRERDVIAWLDEHDATVLLTDWRLNEGAGAAQVVTYEADSLIREIRQSRPTFPIFVVTGYEAQAAAHLKDVEAILNRRDFARQAETVVPQMIRAGYRRFKEQREQFGRMDQLARAVATGAATDVERQELQQLQGYFQAEVSTLISLGSVLGELEKMATEAEAFKEKVEARLEGKAASKKKKARKKK